MRETRKLAAILVADVVGFSRLAGADEDRTLARLRGLRSDVIDPAIAAHQGRIVKRTGDGSIIEFRSVVDAVRCAIEVQSGMIKRNAGLPPERRIEFRVGIHLGDVVEESDGDLMGDGVNIAARLEGVAKPGAICLSEDAYRQVKGRLELAVSDLGATQLKNIAEPIRVYSLEVGSSRPGEARAGLAARKIRPAAPLHRRLAVRQHRRRRGAGAFRRRGHGKPDDRPFAHSGRFRDRPQYGFHLQRKPLDVKTIGRELNVRYVLEGSVQRSGNRMRVNVQLIDAETGNHLWADRFDKPLADLFDMQDEIVARLANALNAQLVAAEARRAEQAPNPDSMDLYFQGLAWFIRVGPLTMWHNARGFFDRALAADPDNVDALIGSAAADASEGVNSFLADPLAAFAAAETKLTKALSSVPDHARGHMYLGFVDILTKRAAEGIAECEHALELDRNLAQAHSFIGFGKVLIGRAEDTEAHIPRPCASVRAIRWLTPAGGKGPPRKLRARSHVVPTVDRGEPKLSGRIF